MEHIKGHHYEDESGRLDVPLLRKPHMAPLGEYRSIAAKRFLTAWRSLKVNKNAQEFTDAVLEYFHMDHAEPVPASDLGKPWEDVYCMTKNTLIKPSSTTSQMRMVFDVSAKIKSWILLNNQRLDKPMVHTPIVDVLLRFWQHKVALVANVSKIYNAVLFRNIKGSALFCWRGSPKHPSLIIVRNNRCLGYLLYHS